MALPHFKPTVEELEANDGVFYHKLLGMEGLRVHRALGVGFVLVRLEGLGDDSSSFS